MGISVADQRPEFPLEDNASTTYPADGLPKDGIQEAFFTGGDIDMTPEEAAALDAESALSEAELESVAVPEGSVAALWKHYKETGSVEDHRKLVENYTPFVEFLAKRLMSRLPGEVELDDLVQDGNVGLLEAIEAFDPSRNIKFETFASRRINGAMQDGLRNIDWVPRLDRFRKGKYDDAVRRLEQRTGLAPTNEDLASEMGIGPDMVEKYLRASMKGRNPKHAGDFRPAHSRHDEDEDPLSLDSAGLKADPDMRSRDLETQELMQELLRTLPSESREIINLFLYEQATLKEIGEYLNMSESRVSQLFSEALELLAARIQEGRSRGPGNLLWTLYEEYRNRRLVDADTGSSLNTREQALLDALNRRAAVQFELSGGSAEFHVTNNTGSFQALMDAATRAQRPNSSSNGKPPSSVPQFTFIDDPSDEQ